MTSSTRDSSPKVAQEHETREDDETRATRRELKQSSISEPSKSAADDDDGDDSRPDTPAEGLDAVASPKKKRAHDQLDTTEADDKAGDDARSVASTESAKDRKERNEPEKKRARDGETSEAKDATGDEKAKSDTKSDGTKDTEKKTETSTSAFAASGFAKLAAAPSPFAAAGGPSKGFGFGSAPKPETPAADAPAAPKLSFGGASGASPFAGVGAAKLNGFGGSSSGASGASVFGGGGASPFGSALGGGSKISSFAAPGAKPLPIGKPAKPFGAPESDAEDSDDGEEGEEGDAEATAAAERALSPDKDDTKKLKLQKVEVETGEAGETTMLSVRAKMFIHEAEAGWKERGAGMLKINVPSSCVDFDDDGNPVLGSFDASGLDAEDDEEAGEAGKGHKVCRLLMRQDNTHRVILNTEILAGMKFAERANLKSVGIMFTAMGETHYQVTTRMSAANSKLFLTEVESIQRELRNR